MSMLIVLYGVVIAMVAVAIQKYHYATAEVARTTLRLVLAQAEDEQKSTHQTGAGSCL